MTLLIETVKDLLLSAVNRHTFDSHSNDIFF
jgi:hypothetical protein